MNSFAISYTVYALQFWFYILLMNILSPKIAHPRDASLPVTIGIFYY